MMESSMILTVRIVHVKTNEVLNVVEKTVEFIEGFENEGCEAKSLEDIINDFVQSVQEACYEREVEIIDREKLFDDLAIALALSSRLKEEKISIDVLVKDSQK
ncbi:MAG: hypothetical protein QXX41_07170 [Nitrososphaerota archaeon]